MSLSLDFEPHSWYKGFAIRNYRTESETHRENAYNWYAYTDNGNTYQVDMLQADTLQELKDAINAYYERQNARDKFNRQMKGE